MEKQKSRREYIMGFSAGLRDMDIRACFREAVLRVRQIYADRLVGRGDVKDDEEKLVDQKLLDGELVYLVPPGHTIHLQGQPQVNFKPERLVIDDESADWYDVVDIKVGKNSQLISADRIPGSGFKAAASQGQSMDTAMISMYVTVSLINVSGKPRQIPRVMMTGWGVD